MKRLLALCLAAALIPGFLTDAARAGGKDTRVGPNIISPAPGVPWPEAYASGRMVSQAVPPGARGWIQKAERVRENRERYIAERGFYERSMLTATQQQELAVTGTVAVPVFMVKYTDTGADPYSTSIMQTRLFDGPYSPRTLTQYYDEISYGNVTMTGQVYGWATLSQNAFYYEQGCQGIFCATPTIDELIQETVAANDAAVDFGQYDNDGPDGIPNSGDDDGFVDFIAIVQPNEGGECGGPGIWSHRWTYSGWTNGATLSTNDPRTGGGFIRVNDYVIQPAYNCSGLGGGVIDIGVFCHEFGHAFGMPDLYDVDGGSQGAGHWALMGSGNWNSTDDPAHMCAWSKDQLGWMNVVQAGGVNTQYAVQNVEQTNTVYKLDVTDERWRRMTDCAIAGSYSLRCGLLATEGAARNWNEPDGYGDEWREKVMRDFHYSGSGSVTLQFDYSYDSEATYDFTYVRIDVGGAVSTVAAYDGTGAGSASLNLTPYLTGAGVTDYTVSFEFESDFAWSDRDGANPTTCGPFVVDNIQLTGGGENYFNNFETREEGWHTDVTPNPNEYFLVSNRQPVGSDVNVHGGGGLSIWRIQQDIIRLGQDINTGGGQYANNRERGVMPEQADNLYNLENNVNRGDGGDPFPGSSNRTSFTNATAPSSRSESNNATNVAVTGIPANPANGGAMTVTMRGGWRAPSYAGVNPIEGNDNEVVTVAVSGGTIAYGADVELRHGGGGGTVTSSAVNWRGYDLVELEFDLNGATPGLYDVVVTNPGGASVTAADAFTVNDATPTGLRSFIARRALDTVRLEWVSIDLVDILGWHVYRSTDGADFRRLTGTPLSATTREFVDPDPVAGVSNTYRLTWITPDGEQIAAQAAVQAGARQFALHQNYPNPFNPTTLIPFEIESEVRTTLSVYNLRGQLVRTLVDGVLAPRAYQIGWDGRDNRGQRVSSGVYFYKLKAGNFQDVRKMTLLQ